MKTVLLLFFGLFFNSILYSQVTFDDGETFYTDSTETVLCHGKYRKFYSGLILKSSENFVKGKLSNESHEFFENGLMKSNYSYKNGLLDGFSLEYFPGLDQIKSKIQYSKGLKNGEAISYDEIGEISETLMYVDGVLQK